MAWFGQWLGTSVAGQWWGDQAAPVNPYLSGGPGFTIRPRTSERDTRRIDRDELRRMLEAAFADAPRDPVVKAAKRAHPIEERATRSIPRVDWSALLSDLEACQSVLERYAERIADGATRTQRREKEREELRYSSESLHDMIGALRAARRARRLRAARAFLLSS